MYYQTKKVIYSVCVCVCVCVCVYKMYDFIIYITFF